MGVPPPFGRACESASRTRVVSHGRERVENGAARPNDAPGARRAGGARRRPSRMFPLHVGWFVLQGRFRPRRDAEGWGGSTRGGAHLLMGPVEAADADAHHAASHAAVHRRGALERHVRRSTTVPSGRLSCISPGPRGNHRRYPRASLGRRGGRGTRRSARGAARAVLKPIIAATCAAIFRAANRPVHCARVNPTRDGAIVPTPVQLARLHWKAESRTRKNVAESRLRCFFRRIRFSRLRTENRPGDSPVQWSAGTSRGRDTFPMGIRFEG